MNLLRLITFRQQQAASPVPLNGLVLYLDAANPTSYPGSGTTWFDLSGNGYNATLINSPTFSGNSFLFEQSTNTYAQLTGSTINKQFGSNEITVFSTINHVTTTIKPSICAFGNVDGTSYNYGFFAAGTRFLPRYQIFWSSGSSWRVGTNSTWTNSIWYGFAHTISGTTLNMYYNQQQAAYVANGTNGSGGGGSPTGPITTFAPTANGALRIGNANGGDEYTRGNMGALLIYKRVLNAGELNQVFNYFARP